MRFGVGEYSPPGMNTARFDAKQELISALFRIVPTLGDELRGPLESLSMKDRTDARIFEEIKRWAAVRGLPADFVIDGIGGFELFDSPFSRAANCAPPYWGGPVAYAWFTAPLGEAADEPNAEALATSCPSGRFEFSHPEEDLARWTRKEAEAFVRFEFDKVLKKWTDEIGRTAAAKGWTRNISKRYAASRGNAEDSDDERDDSPRRHFDWFVQFQVLGRTHNAIANRQAASASSRTSTGDVYPNARAADVAESTVREAVLGVSKLLGMRLRTDVETDGTPDAEAVR
jgi:hypothetical protein